MLPTKEFEAQWTTLVSRKHRVAWCKVTNTVLLCPKERDPGGVANFSLLLIGVYRFSCALLVEWSTTLIRLMYDLFKVQ